MRGRPGSKPRVAYITTAFPWRSETAVIKEMDQHLRMGFEVEVISLKRASFDDTIDPRALAFRETTIYPGMGLLARAVLWSLHDLATRRAYRRLLSTTLRGSGPHLPKTLYLLVLASALARRLQERKIDYIHANFSSFQGFTALAIHRLTGIPFGFTVHAHDIFLHPFLVREKVEEAALVASISAFNVGYMERRLGVPPGKVEVIRCGVDLDEFSAAPEAREGAPLVLSIGRVVPMKGFDVLVDACRRLAAQREFRCLIVGDGPDAAAVRDHIRRAGLEDRVELRSGVSQDDLVALYRQCRLYVQACRVAPNGEMDGIPATLMEAMAVGKPVIASRLSGIPELIDDGRSGLLVAPEDPKALAGAMDRLLGSPERAAEMGRAARAKVAAEFDIRANTAILHRRIRAVIGDAAGAEASA